MSDLVLPDATEQIRRVRDGEISALELTGEYLARIAAHDPHLGAYLTLDPAGARATAREVDRRLASGEEVGPLAGLPVAIKDNLAVRGLPTTCASRTLKGWYAPYEATVVERLRAAGAVLLGKTNLDEFAMGSSTEASAFGATRNPWDLEHVPGGSSGGSAAAVAAGLCAVALGSDTGGSVRQPAAYCGVVGLRPTYGLVSRFGLVAFASSLDQVGPITRSVRDAALLLEVMVGHDPRDSTSLEAAPLAAAPGPEDVAGLRVGLLTGDTGAEPSAGMAAALEAAAGIMTGIGCLVERAHVAHLGEALAAYQVLCAAEASSNLSRFDGVRYGLSPEASSHDQLLRRARGEGFGAEVKRRILLGTYCLSAGFREDLYARAATARGRLTGELLGALERFDLLICPTAPGPAFRLGEHEGDPQAMHLTDAFTAPASLAGLPAMSVPCGRSARGLPLGLQIMAAPRREDRLFTLAAAYEEVAPWPAPPSLLDAEGAAP